MLFVFYFTANFYLLLFLFRYRSGLFVISFPILCSFFLFILSVLVVLLVFILFLILFRFLFSNRYRNFRNLLFFYEFCLELLLNVNHEFIFILLISWWVSMCILSCYLQVSLKDIYHLLGDFLFLLIAWVDDFLKMFQQFNLHLLNQAIA